MKTDIFYKATNLQNSIDYYGKRIIQLERLIAYWKENNIKVNEPKIIFDEENATYRLKETTTIVNIFDAKANVDLRNLIIPIETIADLIKYYKAQKSQLEKEFESL